MRAVLVGFCLLAVKIRKTSSKKLFEKNILKKNSKRISEGYRTKLWLGECVCLPSAANQRILHGIRIVLLVSGYCFSCDLFKWPLCWLLHSTNDVNSRCWCENWNEIQDDDWKLWKWKGGTEVKMDRKEILAKWISDWLIASRLC